MAQRSDAGITAPDCKFPIGIVGNRTSVEERKCTIR